MPAIPNSPRVKLRTTSRRVPRIRAAGEADVSEHDTEPTMRLSRAILVMFLLHVVAVGGFFASSLIKERDLRRSSGAASKPVEAEDTFIASKPRSSESEVRKADASTAATTQNVHIVRPGETPMRIANDNGVSLAALVAVNGSDIVTTGLRTGQELKLPEKSAGAATPMPNSTNKALDLVEGRPHPNPTPAPVNVGSSAKGVKPPVDAARVYVVGKGESAYTIAQKLHVGADALLKFNQIDDPKKLKPGQKLRVPVATKAR